MTIHVQRRSQWSPDAPREWGSDPLTLQSEPEWVVRGDPASLETICRALGSFAEPLAPDVLVLSFGNSVGMFRVPGRGPLVVSSGKWSESDFERMLTDVSRISASLPFSAGEQAKLAAQREFTGEGRVPFHQYLYLRHILSLDATREEQVAPALSVILSDPHRRFVRETRLTRLEQVSRVEPSALFRAYARPGGAVRVGGSLAATALACATGGLVPTIVEEQRAEETFDTAENRLVLAFLDEAGRICSQIRDDARRRNSGSLAAEAEGLLGLLQPYRRARLWDDVGRMEQLPAASTVLQGRRGYRDVFRHYLRLMQAPVWLPLGPDSAQELVEAKDIAKLYELWCFFRVVEEVRRLRGTPVSAGMVEAGPLELRIRCGLEVSWRGVRVLYNVTFGPKREAPFRSYSVPLAPDVTLLIGEEDPAGSDSPGRELQVHLFDAKFKLHPLTGSSSSASAGDDDGAGVARAIHTAEDLHKMHAYRDALAAQSVWVLYPGTESVLFRPNAPLSRDLQIADGPASGVGAISLSPGGESPLGSLVAALVPGA